MDAYDGFAAAAPDEQIAHGAAAPGGLGGDDGVEEWIEAMRDRGMERVCCLLSDAQLGRYDSLLDDYRAAFGPERVAHVPITDHELADEATLREALSVLEAADEAGEPIVAHCLAGIGRTGHVLAAWLVHARGYELDAAVETVRETGRQPAEAVSTRRSETPAELLDLLASVSSQG